MSFLDAAPDPKIRTLKFFLIAVLVVGALAGLLGAPEPLPFIPSWLLAPLWTVSYILMGIAAWLVWKAAGPNTLALKICAVQLLLNLVWRLWPLPALGAALDILALATLAAFFFRARWAGLAFLPCLVWSLFVTWSLNGFWPPH
jgi:tryptophan-rich sensory protein